MSTLITILFLILLNAFFSLSEMAVVASKKSILKDLAKKGNKTALDVLKIIDDQGKFLSTIQVGITAVGILAAAYGGATIANSFGNFLNKADFINPYGHSIALTIVVTVLTYVTVVIGELLPKRLALRNPEKIAIIVAKPMIIFAKIFAPIVSVLDFSAEVVMKFFGVFSDQENNDAEAEVKAIINEGVETGAIDKSEHELMHRIFRLDDREAKSIMTHVSEVSFLKIDDSEEEIKNKLNSYKHSVYPVIEGDSQKVIGLVQSKDLFSDYIDSREIDLNKHLTEAHYIPENIDCLKVLEIFKTIPVNMVIVIDEYGSTEGIVTASDIFEAIVGVIPSNYDENDEVMIKQRDENSWIVDGSTPIDEINLTIGIEDIDDEEKKYDTIGGFVSDHLSGDITETAKFVKYSHQFEIIDMDGITIDKIMIEKILEEDDSSQSLEDEK